MTETVMTQDGEEIAVRHLGHEQLGMRFRLFLGEDENGEYLGDPPTILINICYVCYEDSIRYELDSYIPNEQSEIKAVERVFRTFEEIFADGEVWEWDSECAEVFRYSGYKCDHCQEILLEGVYNLIDGKEHPTIWLNESNTEYKI